MRADRLLSILLLLQVHRRLTAEELAARLEVSPRTIHRDMEALSIAGIPVAAERGQGGGWFLVEGYQTKLTGLKPSEIQALFLANPARLLQDLGLDQAAEDAVMKLLVALPAMYRQDAEAMRQRIHIDVSGWRPSEEQTPLLPVLHTATWEECRLQIEYVRSDGKVVERTVDPLGLVAKGRVWYLVAAVIGEKGAVREKAAKGEKAVAGELRTFRVARLQTVTPTGEACVRPADFDLAIFWEASKVDFVAALPQYPVIVRVAAAILPQLHYAANYARIEEIEPPTADGWQTVRMQFERAEDAHQYALRFVPNLEVLAPAAVRDEVLTRLQRAQALYTLETGQPAAQNDLG